MGLLRETWKRLCCPSGKPLGILLGAGLLVGTLGFVFFHFFGMNAFGSVAFCTSCHEMSGVYEEYQESIHYKNPSGIRAVCSDCHVPHGKDLQDYYDKFVDKLIVGGRHLYHHLIGTYPDRASFEKARYRLAQNVLQQMRDRHAKECRQCHSFEAMQLADQDRSAASKHEKNMTDGGKSCVDCHTGVAHREPDEPEQEVEK